MSIFTNEDGKEYWGDRSTMPVSSFNFGNRAPKPQHILFTTLSLVQRTKSTHPEDLDYCLQFQTQNLLEYGYKITPENLEFLSDEYAKQLNSKEKDTQYPLS